MKKLQLIQLAIILMVIAMPILSQGESRWTLVNIKEEVAIYKQPLIDSDLNQYQAIVHMETSAEDVISVLKEVGVYPEWFGDCKDTRIIKRYSNSHMVLYYAVDAPYPFTDRDAVTDIRFLRNKGNQIVVDIRALSNTHMPADEQHIRVTNLYGRFLITQLNAGVTRVVCQLMTDMGGSMPALIVNRFLMTQIHAVAKGLKQQIARKKGKNDFQKTEHMESIVWNMTIK